MNTNGDRPPAAAHHETGPIPIKCFSFSFAPLNIRVLNNCHQLNHDTLFMVKTTPNLTKKTTTWPTLNPKLCANNNNNHHRCHKRKMQQNDPNMAPFSVSRVFGQLHGRGNERSTWHFSHYYDLLSSSLLLPGKFSPSCFYCLCLSLRSSFFSCLTVTLITFITFTLRCTNGQNGN